MPVDLDDGGINHRVLHVRILRGRIKKPFENISFDPVLNRPGFVGGSNFQIGWSRYEQNNEQILP